MKFLCDENVPLTAVDALRRSGHDVLAIAEHRRGLADDAVMELAALQDRVLITLDRDFGELVFLRRSRPPPAVVLIRAPLGDPEADLAGPVLALIQQTDIAGHFWVMNPSNWRRRPLPHL